MASLRHEFYETDERLTLEVFDKGADPAAVSVTFQPRSLAYTHGEKTLVLEPLKGQIDPEKSTYTVGKFKVEIRLAKMAQGRWGALVGDSPDPLTTVPAASAPAPTPRQPQKNWEGITAAILDEDKDGGPSEDPNAGGDTAVNGFFQKLYADADEDTRRAMLKSYQESGGTTLSTNWDEVGKAPVEVKPPEGSEWKKWAA
ncbi:SGS-domain-containing protein [Sparassis latifolia]